MQAFAAALGTGRIAASAQPTEKEKHLIELKELGLIIIKNLLADFSLCEGTTRPTQRLELFREWIQDAQTYVGNSNHEKMVLNRTCCSSICIEFTGSDVTASISDILNVLATHQNQWSFGNTSSIQELLDVIDEKMKITSTDNYASQKPTTDSLWKRHADSLKKWHDLYLCSPADSF